MVVRGSGKNERAETHQGMGGDVKVMYFEGREKNYKLRNAGAS